MGLLGLELRAPGAGSAQHDRRPTTSSSTAILEQVLFSSWPASCQDVRTNWLYSSQTASQAAQRLQAVFKSSGRYSIFPKDLDRRCHQVDTITVEEMSCCPDAQVMFKLVFVVMCGCLIAVCLIRRGAEAEVTGDRTQCCCQVTSFTFTGKNSWPKLGLPGPLNSAVMSVCVRYLIPEYVIPNMSWMRLRAAPEAGVLLHSLLKPVD